MTEPLTFTLTGTPTDDGRTYINSPDLDGFYFIFGADEKPEVMKDTLRQGLELHLKAEVKKEDVELLPENGVDVRVEVANWDVPDTAA